MLQTRKLECHTVLDEVAESILVNHKHPLLYGSQVVEIAFIKNNQST